MVGRDRLWYGTVNLWHWFWSLFCNFPSWVWQSYRSAVLCRYSFNFASVYCMIQVMLINDINTLLKLQITINTMQNTPQHGNMFILLKCVVTYIFAHIIIFLKSIVLHKYTQKCMQISSSAVLEACHSELHLGIWSIPTSTQIKTRRAKRYFPIQQMWVISSCDSNEFGVLCEQMSIPRLLYQH